MHVLILTSEVAPFSSSGDLGEAVGTLATALRNTGTRVTVITPYYDSVPADRLGLARRIRRLEVPVGRGGTVEIGLLDGKFPASDVHTVLVDHPESFHRGSMYADGSKPFPDNHLRFELLCRSAPVIAEELSLAPDVLHSFDWHTGLALLMTDSLGPVRKVFTVPDANFAGLFPKETLEELGLASDLFRPEGIEFHGQISLLKAGVLGADFVVAPSPTYARELTTEPFGAGLHGLFQALGDRLRGVQAGIDYGTWNPLTDHRIAAHFDHDDLEGKAECKRALQQELGLAVRSQGPLVACFAPFTEARGFDLVLESVPGLTEQEQRLQLVFVGGDDGAAQRIDQLARQLPPSMVARAANGDPDGLHRILAGADAVLLPPRYEPGGQLPLKALRYGAVPVFHRVGGLADVLVDFDPPSGTGTGIAFNQHSTDGLVAALRRLLARHDDPSAWQALVRNGMRQRHTMELTARRYLEIYGGDPS